MPCLLRLSMRNMCERYGGTRVVPFRHSLMRRNWWRICTLYGTRSSETGTWLCWSIHEVICFMNCVISSWSSYSVHELSNFTNSRSHTERLANTRNFLRRTERYWKYCTQHLYDSYNCRGHSGLVAGGRCWRRLLIHSCAKDCNRTFPFVVL